MNDVEPGPYQGAKTLQGAGRSGFARAPERSRRAVGKLLWQSRGSVGSPDAGRWRGCRVSGGFFCVLVVGREWREVEQLAVAVIAEEAVEAAAESVGGVGGLSGFVEHPGPDQDFAACIDSALAGGEPVPDALLLPVESLGALFVEFGGSAFPGVEAFLEGAPSLPEAFERVFEGFRHSVLMIAWNGIRVHFPPSCRVMQGVDRVTFTDRPESSKTKVHIVVSLE